MKIIHRVLQRPEFEKEPPVLVDVGASGGLHAAWKPLAKYSLCIAFDPDDREMRIDTSTNGDYRKLYVYNRVLTAGPESAADFYLTKAPACSSVLPPRPEKLASWEFAERFEVLQTVRVETIHLQTVLRELQLNRIDWFKTDSQGTDVRLFESLGEPLVRRVLIAEFEPGILESYQGDDKLWQVMAAMDRLNFWMCDMEIKGSQRIRKSLMRDFWPVETKYMVHLLKTAPGWAEVAYINAFREDDFSLRDWLLGWVCATLKGEHGFAMELATTAQSLFNDPMCEDLRQHSIGSIRSGYFNLFAYSPLIVRVLRKWKKQMRHRKRSLPFTSVPAGQGQMPGGSVRD